MRKKNNMKGSQRLEQVIQGGCGVFVLGSTHDLTQPWATSYNYISFKQDLENMFSGCT